MAEIAFIRDMDYFPHGPKRRDVSIRFLAGKTYPNVPSPAAAQAVEGGFGELVGGKIFDTEKGAGDDDTDARGEEMGTSDQADSGSGEAAASDRDRKERRRTR